MKKYGTVTANNDNTFYAQRMIPSGFSSEKTHTHIGVFTTMLDAAKAVVEDYCRTYNEKVPTLVNTTEEDEVMDSQTSTMPSVQVVYEAHIAVNIYPDGTARAEVLLANYDDGPDVTDAEGRSIERGTVLHKAAWDAAADLIQQDSYALPLEVKA